MTLTQFHVGDRVRWSSQNGIEYVGTVEEDSSPIDAHSLVLVHPDDRAGAGWIVASRLRLEQGA